MAETGYVNVEQPSGMRCPLLVALQSSQTFLCCLLLAHKVKFAQRLEMIVARCVDSK